MASRFDGGTPYTGETLDVKSRSKVRRMLDRYMKGPWSRWWVGVSKVARGPLVKEAMGILLQYWMGRDDEACACYSADAVAEEIDFYLPKIFWKVKRRKRCSGGKTIVDPEWATFEKWNFAYPETRARLAAEAHASSERIERAMRAKA